MKRGPLVELATADLPHLGFRCFLPDPRLRPWVQCYWMVSRSVFSQGCEENMYPDGGSTLSFDLMNESAMDARFSSSQRLHSKYFQGAVRSFGIRFYPGGAAGLFKLPLGEAEAVNVCAQDLGILNSRSLGEELREYQNFYDLVTAAESWLLHYAHLRDAKPGVIQELWTNIRRPQNRVADLLADLPFSRRTLERMFRQEVGISPARLRVLDRVKQARLLIKAEPHLTLTDVALRSNFYDQADFIRHFRSVTTLTPGQYRQRQLNKLQNGMLRRA